MDSTSDLQKQIEIGKMAEEFLQYLAGHPYFESLIERIDLGLASQLLSLPAQDATGFFSIQTQRSAVHDVLEAVRGDVQIGARAFEALAGGSVDNGGLL